MDRTALLRQIYNISPQNFDQICLELFYYQNKHNTIYSKFVELLGIDYSQVREVSKIPFLPISFFKTHKIQSGNWPSSTTFNSSGTTGSVSSQHLVYDLDLYRRNALEGFEAVYGSIKDYQILALLPSYLERSGSSLIYMTEQFIKESKHPESGFFLYDHQDLAKRLKEAQLAGRKVLLLGVTYALLDFAAAFPGNLSEGQVIVMETGGMKGRRKELLRTEVHQLLGTAFGLQQIHSEYGMTELLSQAYSKGNGVFEPSKRMRICIREATDPLNLMPFGRSGGINIIDLANIDSCAFIATDDLGKVYEDGSFEVSGRFDASDIRGCNLMLEL